MVEKLQKQSRDEQQHNYRQLLEFVAANFPSCVVESLSSSPKAEQADTEQAPALSIDWQALGQMVGAKLSEEQAQSSQREPFAFVWPSKQETLREAMRPLHWASEALHPVVEESINWDETGNLYIEGDNLTALKLLQNSYLGKVKMIYIDPPYNTGNDKSFVYDDNFAQDRDTYAIASGQIDETTGARLVSNPDTEPRYHSLWCSMIYARLLVARSLLRRDGVIFISIDDHEQHHLRAICDEVFGEQNLVAQFVWQRNPSPKNDKKFVAVSHEYILAYARNLDSFAIGRLPFSDESKARDYANPDNDPRGLWTSSPITAMTYSKAYDYPITTPSGRVVYPTRGRSWSMSKETFEQLVADKRIDFGKSGNNRPRLKRFFAELKDNESTVPRSLLLCKEVGKTQDGSGNLKKLGLGGVFGSPKPVTLLRHLLTLANLDPQGHDIVLDFFSGSASTAEAVLRANADDGGNRRFILVQLNEECAQNSPAKQAGFSTIPEIGKERIRRVASALGSKFLNNKTTTTTNNKCTKTVHGGGIGVLESQNTAQEADKYETLQSSTAIKNSASAAKRNLELTSEEAAKEALEEDAVSSASTTIAPSAATKAEAATAAKAAMAHGLDLGFRVFRVDESSFVDNRYSLEEYANAIGQNSLGLELESSIKPQSADLDLLFECVLLWHLPLNCPYCREELAGYTIYSYNHGDLMACFADEIGADLVEALATLSTPPLRFVLCDHSFESSSAKINLCELFKTLLPEVELRIL